MIVLAFWGGDGLRVDAAAGLVVFGGGGGSSLVMFVVGGLAFLGS